MFVVGGMSQLADYVYRDYHTRMDALHSRLEHAQVCVCERVCVCVCVNMCVCGTMVHFVHVKIETWSQYSCHGHTP